MVDHDVFAATEASGYGPVEPGEPEQAILDSLRVARPWVLLLAVAVLLGGTLLGMLGAVMLVYSASEEVIGDPYEFRLAIAIGSVFSLLAIGCFAAAASVGRFGLVTNANSLEGAATALRRAKVMWRTVALLASVSVVLMVGSFVALLLLTAYQ